MRLFCIFVALCVCALALFAGCGKGAHKSTRVLPAVTNEQASAPRDIEGVLAEIDGYQPPAGVDSKLFERMRTRLREGILRNNSTRQASLLDSDICRNVNIIQDLKQSSLPSEPVRLTWGYHNLGDYSQNGTVSVDDVTPIAIHYGEYYPDMWQAIDEVIDEGWRVPGYSDGYGLIGDDPPQVGNGGRDLEILYLPGIYGNTISGYAVYGSDDPNGPYTECNPQQVIPFSQIQGDDRDANGILDGRGWFDSQVTGFGKRFIKVVPIDGQGNRYESLGANYIDMRPFVPYTSVTPRSGTPGAVVTFTCDATIQPPGTTYQWNFGGGATPNIATGHSVTVTLRSAGTYSASVTVNNGFDTFPSNWVLTVTNAPVITSIDPLKVITGVPTQFTVNWTGDRTGAITYNWDFDTWAMPGTSTDESPTVTPGAPGYFRHLRITITNTYGSGYRDFDIVVGRLPNITGVSPTNAVGNFSQSYVASLDYRDFGPYYYVWNFGTDYYPERKDISWVDWTFYEPGPHQCSVTVTNAFGSDTEEFTVYVRLNRLWLVAEPPAAFTWQYFEGEGGQPGHMGFNNVTVRVIAVDNGYPMRSLQNARVQYDGIASLEGGVDSGALGGGASGDGIWQAFNDHNLYAMISLTSPESLATYSIVGEPPPPLNPPPLSKWFQYAVAPGLNFPDPYELPAGSGLSLAEYVARDSGSLAGDVFNFTLSLGEYVPGPSNPTEVKVRMVNKVNQGTLCTDYLGYDDGPWLWNVVQQDDAWVPVPDRYYLRIPVII